MNLFCENDGLVETSACQIARILSKRDVHDVIFPIIKIFRVCARSCPLDDARLRLFDGVRNLDLVKKQFDIASTNNLFQDICMYTDEDILLSLVHGPGFSLEVEHFFSFTLLMKGFYCCLLL